MVGSCKKRIKFYKKTIIIAIFSLFTAFFGNYSEPVSALSSGSGAVVIEVQSKRILYSDGADLKLAPASTTKVLTALAVIKNNVLSKIVSVPEAAVGIEGSSIYLKAGEKLTVKELLYGLMLRSGNDAAVALAIDTSGSIEEFSALMNRTAKECGALNSNFVNPHGLHDDCHYTTAYDLALITAEAYKYADFCEIVSAKSVTIGEGDSTRLLYNKNKMLSLYEGANGVKTGYTKRSGRCLVSAAKRQGMQLICVVLNHGDMWNDSMAYMDMAFDKYSMIELIKAEENITDITVKGGKTNYVLCAPEIPHAYPLTEQEAAEINIQIDVPEYLTAPLAFKQNVGKIRVYTSDRLLFEGNFYTMQAVKSKGVFG